MKLPLLFFAIGLLVGGTVAWEAKAPEAPTAPSISQKRSPSLPRKSIAQIRAEILASKPGDARIPSVLDASPYDGLVEDWTTKEIRAALDDAIIDLALGTKSIGPPAGILLKEWLKRDHHAVVTWFDAIEVPATKRSLAIHLSMGWPVDRAKDGLEFLVTHKDLFSTSSPWAIVEKNIIVAAQSGPTDLAALFDRLRHEDLPLSFMLRTPFPEGFDFATFFESEAYPANHQAPVLSSIASEWLDQDALKAAEFLMNHGGSKELLKATDGVNFIRDNESSARLWASLAEFVESLPTDQQAEFMTESEQRLQRNPIAADHFANHLTDPDLSDQAHELAAQVIARGQLEESIAHLDAIRDSARRIAFLAALETSPFSKKAPTSEQRKLVQAKLTSWGASPSEMQVIINQLFP